MRTTRLDSLFPDALNRRFGTWRGAIRTALGEVEYQSGRLRPWVHPDPGCVKRLVFVCLGNINRSAFAGALAKHRGLPEQSIGISTSTGLPATDQAIAAAKRYGIDLEQHRANTLQQFRPREGDLLLVMEVRHARQLQPLQLPGTTIALLGLWSAPRRIHIHDPHTLSPDYYRTCFDLLESAVTNLEMWLKTGRAPLGREGASGAER